MKKSIFIFISFTLIAVNCSTPKRIKSSANLFNEVTKSYPLSTYNIELKTAENKYYLSDPKILPDGTIEGTPKPTILKDKNLIFTTRPKYKTKSSTDSNLIQKIRFSEDDVIKISVHDKGKTPNKQTIYDEFLKENNKRTDRIVLGMLAGIISALLLIVVALSSSSFSCYIATMVYGSYDAPEVLILRKYRDEKLATNFFGRLFIQFYYTVSPTFVRLFKNNKTVNKFAKLMLDRWVKRLEKRGFVLN